MSEEYKEFNETMGRFDGFAGMKVFIEACRAGMEATPEDGDSAASLLTFIRVWQGAAKLAGIEGTDRAVSEWVPVLERWLAEKLIPHPGTCFPAALKSANLGRRIRRVRRHIDLQLEINPILSIIATIHMARFGSVDRFFERFPTHDDMREMRKRGGLQD